MARFSWIININHAQVCYYLARGLHCYNITKENWYKTEKGTERVLGELARCGNQFVGDLK